MVVKDDTKNSKELSKTLHKNFEEINFNKRN